MPESSHKNDLRMAKTAQVFDVGWAPEMSTLHSNTSTEAFVLLGVSTLQGALLQRYTQTAIQPLVKKSIVKKSSTEADRQLAVVQRETLLGFNRKTWAVPQGMTSAVARYKARKIFECSGSDAHPFQVSTLAENE